GWRIIAAAHVGRYISFVRFGDARRFSPDDPGRSHARKRRTACAPVASSQMGRTGSCQPVSALFLAPVAALMLAVASSAATSLPRMKARRIGLIPHSPIRCAVRLRGTALNDNDR